LQVLDYAENTWQGYQYSLFDRRVSVEEKKGLNSIETGNELFWLIKKWFVLVKYAHPVYSQTPLFHLVKLQALWPVL